MLHSLYRKSNYVHRFSGHHRRVAIHMSVHDRDLAAKAACTDLRTPIRRSQANIDTQDDEAQGTVQLHLLFFFFFLLVTFSPFRFARYQRFTCIINFWTCLSI